MYFYKDLYHEEKAFDNNILVTPQNRNLYQCIMIANIYIIFLIPIKNILKKDI